MINRQIVLDTIHRWIAEMLPSSLPAELTRMENLEAPFVDAINFSYDTIQEGNKTEICGVTIEIRFSNAK